MLKRTLAIFEKALGPGHPEVGAYLNDLATVYRAQSRYAEAEPLFKRALAIAEKTGGSDHLALGKTLGQLALLYYSQGRYAEAEPLFKHALAIFEKTLGATTPKSAHSSVILRNFIAPGAAIAKPGATLEALLGGKRARTRQGASRHAS